MADILIRRLRVRVVRRGTLFWGNEPRALARVAIAVLPEVLASGIDEMGLARDADVEVVKPVELRFTGSASRLHELLAGGAEGLRQDAIHALERALAQGEGVVRRSPARVPPGERKTGSASQPGAGSPPLGELIQLHLRGELRAFLEGLPVSCLNSCHRDVLEHPLPHEAGSSAEALASEARDVQEALDVIERLARGWTSEVGERSKPERRVIERLIAAVELASSTGIAPSRHAARAALDRFLPRIDGPALAGHREENALPTAAQGRTEASGAPLGFTQSAQEETFSAAAIPAVETAREKSRGPSGGDALDTEIAAAPHTCPGDETGLEPPEVGSTGSGRGDVPRKLENRVRSEAPDEERGGQGRGDDRARRAERPIEGANDDPAAEKRSESGERKEGRDRGQARGREGECRGGQRNEATPGATSPSLDAERPGSTPSHGRADSTSLGRWRATSRPHRFQSGNPWTLVESSDHLARRAKPGVERLRDSAVASPVRPLEGAMLRTSASRALDERGAALRRCVEHSAPILPLLVACHLQRAGILAQVEQHLARNDQAEELPLWIAALVLKLGPPPLRGWLIPPGCWTCAALISGTNLLSGEGLVRWADAPSVRWSELTSNLIDRFAAPHDPLVAATYRPGAMALFRTDPTAPIWVGEHDALLAAASGHSLTRDSATHTGFAPELEKCSGELSAQIRMTVDLLASRTACPLAWSPDLDHHLATVVGWSLSQIGHMLWPDESPPAPLVIARFSSLEVQVRCDEEGLSVRVPLGKRHRDLSRAGLLSDLPRAGWLRGGAVRFRGG